VLIWGKSSLRNLEPIRVENAWPAIIDISTYAKAQTMLRSRASINAHPQPSAYYYLLSRLANALSFTERCTQIMMIILGDDEKFWVVTPAHATRLIKQGHELA